MESSTPQSDSSDDGVLDVPSHKYLTKALTNKSGPSAYYSVAQEVQQRQKCDNADGGKPRKLGVTWSNLTVKGVSADATYNENMLSQFNPKSLISKKLPTKTIIDKSFGCVKPGEMLLVLGRPGSGCTTLLNMLSNRRLGYAEVSGDVHFGSMTSDEAKAYRGRIVMNDEEEVFYPTLSVANTIDFATRMKVPYKLPAEVTSPEEYSKESSEFLLRTLGISHTVDTKVGDAFVRGVSGGERKRVSIAEVLSTRGSVFTWDNSTRGLDASTALQWAKMIRAMTDILELTTIVTLYQAGNGIFDQFDKVLVLDEGKQVYYGPRDQAVPFAERLGFLCDPSAYRADFLTGVTVPTERAIAKGYEDRFPRNADELRAAYEETSIKQDMLAECDYHESAEAIQNTADFKEMELRDKDKSLPKSSPVTTGPWAQVKSATVRQFQIVWGDKPTLFVTQIATLAQALLAGSLFYNAPANSSGLFLKGGAIFFNVLYPGLLALSEVTNSFTGRPVLAKHRAFAMYYPAAVCIAQIVVDIPVLLFQVTQFSIVLYFMVGLQMDAGVFFTFWIVSFVSAMTLTMLFRLIGAGFKTFDASTKASGLVLTSFFIYMGYMVTKPKMHPWFVWIFWINPMAYAFEALLANEFHNQVIPCAGRDIIPNGAGYGIAGGQACAGVGGAQVGASSVLGDDYLASMSFSHNRLWRNFGILCAWWVFFAALTIFFTSRWKQMGEGGRSLLIPREQQHVQPRAQPADEESQTNEKMGSRTASDASDEANNGNTPGLVANTSVFTWKNLTYTVKTPSGDRVLLDNVQGFIKPGMLGALMGSSGAGKTTLLDVLAQRKTDGTVKGSILVDGRPLPVSFQRSAGYVEQMDVHESLATVREALEFSALLRQSRETPREEKLKYVDTIIELLQLQDIEHTLIGRPGAGLSVEQRKRLTIGVELVSKPSILIFLDEPTSGLDGQAAFNTMRFLRKLAAVGQAILVTIHQPSAQLFSQFDTLLLLGKGGRTMYFGDVGENASQIKSYFARYDAPCPDEANPAEHMIEVTSGSLSQDRDWNKVWLESPEHEITSAEIDRITADAAAQPPKTFDDGHEFAAPMWEQTKLVTQRMNRSLYRDTEYVDNKFVLHILLALVNGFTFWQVGSSLGDLQSKLFAVFNFIFVAPGVISQLQPLFIARRDIYEVREKKAKMYHWAPFVTALIVSELPYLVICGFLYFVCWYWTVGFPSTAWNAGGTFFVVVSPSFSLAASYLFN